MFFNSTGFLVTRVATFILSFLIGLVMGTASGVAGVFGFVVAIIIPWLYYAFMESGDNQAALGKMALCLKVTDLESQRISFSTATGRYFGKIISALILLIGYFMAGFREKKQALHDIMAGTLVLSKNG